MTQSTLALNTWIQLMTIPIMLSLLLALWPQEKLIAGSLFAEAESVHP